MYQIIETCVMLLSFTSIITSPWQFHYFLNSTYSRISFLNIIFIHDFNIAVTILNIFLILSLRSEHKIVLKG